MSKVVENYKLGNIDVTIEETDNPEKLKVICKDDSFQMSFKARLYEYQYYKRHMNQKIRERFEKAHNEEKG